MDVHDVVLLEKLFTLKGYLEAVDGEDRFRDDTDPQDDRGGCLSDDTNPERHRRS